MKAELAPIIRDSERLLREVVISAAKMPKDYKWMLGTKLRDDAIESLLLAQKAFRSTSQPAMAQQFVERLADHNDAIQALLQVSYDAGALSSRGRLNELATIAKNVGRQCGGWLVSIKGKHPNGQSPASSAIPESAGTLSTRDAHQGSTKTNPRYQSDVGAGQKITRERSPWATSGL